MSNVVKFLARFFHLTIGSAEYKSHAGESSEMDKTNVKEERKKEDRKSVLTMAR